MKPSEKITAIYDKYLNPERNANELTRLEHMVSSIMHYLDEEQQAINEAKE